MEITEKLDRNKILDRLWALWSIQENLLQRYRAMALTCEAIFLGFSLKLTADIWRDTGATGLYAQELLLLASIVLGFFFLVIFSKIVRSRERHVGIVQKLISVCEVGDPIPNCLASGQILQAFNSARNSEQDDSFHLEEGAFDLEKPGPTRRSIALVLRAFGVVWIIIFIALLLEFLTH